MNKIDQLLLQHLTQAIKKKKILISISEDVHEEFRRICGTASVSRVIEHLMREFIERNKK